MDRRGSRSLAAVVATVIMITAGCGASGSTGSPDGTAGTAGPTAAVTPGATAGTTGPPGACTLLTADQVTALFGSPAGEPKPGLNVTGEHESSCDWEPAESSVGVVTLLQLQIFDDSRYLSRGAYDDTEILQDVSLAGASEAFVIDEGSGIGINMVVGSMRVVVHYTPGGGTEPLTTLAALTTVAGQLAAAVTAG